VLNAEPCTATANLHPANFNRIVTIGLLGDYLEVADQNHMAQHTMTLAKAVTLRGKGLHNGKQVTLCIRPRTDQSGYRFIRTDLKGNDNWADAQDIDPIRLPLRTALKRGQTNIHTTEHVLSALAGCGIGAAILEVDGLEIPGMDGSALEFAQAIRKVGTQPGPLAPHPYIVHEPIQIQEGQAKISVFPHPGFKISYSLYYEGNSLAQGDYDIDLGRGLLVDEEARERYFQQIAPARTLCMKDEALKLRQSGFGLGADYENTLVIDGDKVIQTTLRFPDEPVRHKILDVVGDLAVLERPVLGHFRGIRSGHTLNRRLTDAIKKGCPAV